MGARILWRDAQGREGSVDLGPGDTVIGRAMDCAIRTDDAMVSRHHARLFWQSGQYYLEDLGSANGIYYQEQRVNQHRLRHGDAVRCGSLWIRFLDTAPAQPAAPPQRHSAPAPAQPQHAQQPVGAGAGGKHSGRTAYLPAEEPAANPHPGLGPARGGHEGHPGLGPSRPQPSPRPAEPARSSAGPRLQGVGAELRGPGGDRSPARERAHQEMSPSGVNARELAHLQRRVEQLKSELRIYRGGGDGARTYEELEQEIDNLSRERSELRKKVDHLERVLREDGANAKVLRAGEIAQTAGDIVAGLNDVLSNLRINVMAAEGEFDQFASALPRASFELIREALRSSAHDMETARDMLRKLRQLAGLR